MTNVALVYRKKLMLTNSQLQGHSLVVSSFPIPPPPSPTLESGNETTELLNSKLSITLFINTISYKENNFVYCTIFDVHYMYIL